jgi:hypothetical protein
MEQKIFSIFKNLQSDDDKSQNSMNSDALKSQSQIIEEE